MIRLFFNGLAASAGGGLTYLHNVIPEIGRSPAVEEVTFLLSPDLRKEFRDSGRISFVEMPVFRNTLRRVFLEQTRLAEMIRGCGADVLISAGNFALWNSPVPQILLSRNSLYTSADFSRDVQDRGDYAIWLDTLIKGWLARQSILQASLTVAPSEAFARDLTEWSGRKVVAVHHGFNRQSFMADVTPLPAETRAQLAEGQDALRLLFVSHYNYYRNFETLFRAVPIIRKNLNGKRVELYLTCRLNSSQNPGTYRAEGAASLAGDLRADRDIVELGTVPYRSLHHLYRACHIYVTPAYAESFAHPLVEAMASGMPIVASDLPVHREICEKAGVYFPRFSPDKLAEQVLRIYKDQELSAELSRHARDRSRDFSWEKHVARLLDLAEGLAHERKPE